MKTKILKTNECYDGSQLRSQFAYLQYRILGDSAVSWVGPCEVSFEHMVDGEDLLDHSEIRGSKMVHFIIEVFDQSLFSGVLLQRLFAGIVRDVIYESSPLANFKLSRGGDDLFWGGKKLSISIASQSPISTMIHFAVNIETKNVPVEACGLKDFKVEEQVFMKKCLEKLSREFASIKEATWKVKPLP